MITSAGHDLVPLAERRRFMHALRLVAVAVVAVSSLAMPEVLGVSPRALVAGTALYLAAVAASAGVERVLRGRALWLFATMLIVDGLWLAWIVEATGGTVSSLRYLVVLHLVAVALLASYRTSMKLALWHSLLLLVVFYAREAGVLETAAGASQVAPGDELQRTSAFIVGFWLVSIVTATFSAVNERELRRRRYDLEALAKFAEALENASDSRAVAETLLGFVTDTFGFRRAVLLGSPHDPFALLTAHGIDVPRGIAPRPDPGSVVHRAASSHNTLLLTRFDARTDAWLSTLFPDGRNFIVVPLFAEASPTGVLVVEHAARSGSRIERRIVAMAERFTSHGALALRNAWLLEQMQKMATTDGLTGVANRRTFDETLAKELSRAQRAGDALSLVLADIDHFKKLNDTYGHQTGDDVLREVAAALAGTARDFDLVARYGGEEFAVILPRCAQDVSLEVAERLRLAFASAATAVPVTASLGVATFPHDGADAASLLKAADDALYESKRAGRNRSTRAGAIPPLVEDAPRDGGEGAPVRHAASVA